MLKQGLIQAYLLPPRRFNFISFGLALRAAGRGLRNLIISFPHNQLDESYRVASSYLSPLLSFQAIDLSHNSGQLGGPVPTAYHVLSYLEKNLRNGHFDLVHILDVEKVFDSGLIKVQDLIELCKGRPGHVEVILSGSTIPQAVLEVSELVTKVVMENHSSAESVDRLDSGAVEIVTGNGKGKTTYCLGKSLLAAAQGMSCLFLQFIKSPMRYGETIAADKIPNITVKTMGKGFVFQKNGKIASEHREAAREAWNTFRQELNSQKYQLIVLDELNIALYYDFIQLEEVASAIREKPRETLLIFSGRNAHPYVSKLATSVIEMREIKHPLKKGIKARKGIEY